MFESCHITEITNWIIRLLLMSSISLSATYLCFYATPMLSSVNSYNQGIFMIYAITNLHLQQLFLHLNL